MIQSTRITFYLPKDGMSTWLLQRIRQFVFTHQANAKLVQIYSQKAVDITETLNVMALAFKPYELCQIILQAKDVFRLQTSLCLHLKKHTQLIMPIESIAHQNEVNAILNQFDFDFSFQAFDTKLAQFKKLFDKLSPQSSLTEYQVAQKDLILQNIAKMGSKTEHLKLLAQLRQRESYSPTTMAGNVAFPHIRSESILKMKLIVITLEEPIDWGGRLGAVSHIVGLLLPQTPKKPELLSIKTLTLNFLNPQIGYFFSQHKDPIELKVLLDAFCHSRAK